MVIKQVRLQFLRKIMELLDNNVEALDAILEAANAFSIDHDTAARIIKNSPTIRPILEQKLAKLNLVKNG